MAALSTSPRKMVPLSGGEDWEPPPKPLPAGPAVTKRVFYCGVVVEGSEGGRRLPEDVQDLVVSLGNPLGSGMEDTNLSETNGGEITDPSSQRRRALTDSTALSDVINEFVATERSYVKRLRILKTDYADPLRKFSKSKDTAILPPYEAKTLFGNVDQLLPVNEAFLVDLEKMMATGQTATGIGDVALRHFRDLRGFEHYRQYYVKREEAQSIFEREMLKKSSGFAAFIDRIKYSSSDTKNRVGLRELLMDPVQRIPRYTLMFRLMVKHMATTDPQRAKLTEADEIASKIAHAETDDQTKRAAIMFCLGASVDGFPPGLVSNSRRFIDCIDVEDLLVDSSSSSSSGPSWGSLHCSLFLFDDKLVIVKRPGNGEKGARALSGLDELDKVTKAGGLPTAMKKSGLSFKGMVDITDAVATDVGGADFHLYLETPPKDQSDRWSGRPFRSLAVVHPPSPINLDPTRTEIDKNRFLENLWHAQATYRTKAGQSVALCAEEQEVESRGGRTTMARTYFNVYQRKAFLQEPKKTKLVVHIDPSGSADPIPFGVNAPPFVVIRVHPMAGALSRYTVTSSDPNDDGEEDIVQTARVPSRIVQTTQQFALFKFRTNHISAPSTPTASLRTRTNIFGLDAISRNLFNAKPGSSKGDFFGGSINSQTRSRSTTSRSSLQTQTTGTTDVSMKFSHRSNSTATASTTISSVDGSESLDKSRSPSRSRKFFGRTKSPGGSEGENRRTPPRSNKRHSRARSQSPFSEQEFLSDGEGDSVFDPRAVPMDESEWDLTRRLELARQNSQTQHVKQAPLSLDKPMQDTIYEEDPPQPLRPPSRASRDSRSSHTITSRPGSTTPTLDSPPDRSHSHSRSTSQHSTERRPIGPRSPSPLPPMKSPRVEHPARELPSMDVDLALEASVPKSLSLSEDDIVSPIPRSKRQSFFPNGFADATPRASSSNASAVPQSVEPLSIKKKTSVRSSGAGSVPTRKSLTRSSPLSRTPGRIVSPRKVSPQVRAHRTGGSVSSAKGFSSENLALLVQSTKEDVESAHRAVKRIKLDFQANGGHSRSNSDYRPLSPDKLSRTPQKNTPMSKAALDRMEEMRLLIGKRQGESTPKSNPRPFADNQSHRGTNPSMSDETARTVDVLALEAECSLERARGNCDLLQTDLNLLAVELKERGNEQDKARIEIQNAKRQCELVKSLLADATAEKDIMYEAFNEELDGMYNDANLPKDEAWAALTKDLRQTKELRNKLSRENSDLKRKLAEVESQHEEWASLLRTHGLIP